jgi:2-dehydro-3-deoxyphosphogluconate aldolase/(4S)-4-hydroxy-2-oxoglutarate aldolase
VNLKTAADFIKAGAAALGVGADLVQGERSAITEKAKQFVEIVRQARES